MTNYIFSNELFLWQKMYWLTYRWLLDLWRDPTLQATKISEKIVNVAEIQDKRAIYLPITSG